MILKAMKGTTNWKHMNYIPVIPPNVISFDYKIDGILYTKRTPKFCEAFRIQRMWKKLQGS